MITVEVNGHIARCSTDLERLYEGPEKDADSVALTQQLDETSRSEQSQKTNVDGSTNAASL